MRRWNVLVFALAVAARLTVVLRHGGAHGLFGYDSGVYFAASDALVHGRLPYRDFVQLHPPVMDLVLAPVTALTHVMSDDSAFTVGIALFVAMGGVNAVLAGEVCRRSGFGSRAVVVAGLVYAVWFGAIESEYLIKLEPLGNFFLLVALLLALRADRAAQVTDRARPWASVLAGVPLGLAVSTKIWWIAPLVAVVVWHGVRRHSLGRAGAMLGGAVAAAVVVDVPFFLAAPGRMWHMVVLDQLGRPRIRDGFQRLADLTTVPRLATLTYTAEVTWSIVFLVLLLGVAAFAWRTRAARAAVVLLAVLIAVVLSSPSFYPYYCDFLTVGLALTVGGAVASPAHSRVRQRGPRRAVIRVLAPLVGAGVAGLTLATLIDGHVSVPSFPGGARLARAVRDVPCVTSNSPVALIQLNALSRGLANGCANPIDVTGRRFGPDRSSKPLLRNVAFQRALLAYLRQGQATIIIVPREAGITAELEREIAQYGVLARVGSSVVYRAPG